MKTEEAQQEETPVQAVRRHAVKTDIAWTGSGRDGDPWQMCSWDIEWCDCDQPWRHGGLA